MKWKYLFLAAASCLLLATTRWSAQGEAAATDVADLWLTAVDFGPGSGSGYLVTGQGLTMATTAATGVYTSPILEAPIPFNAIVPQWIADVPDDADLEILLRTASSEGEWSQWYDIHPQTDWMLPGEPDIVGEMIVVPETTTTHNRIQFSIAMGRWDGAAPLLRQLRFTVIDTTSGPTMAELVAAQQAYDGQQAADLRAVEEVNAYPKPLVITREVWCVPHYGSECYYSDIDHHPVTHMILHHTVSSNDYTDSAPIVRAIWRFHNYTRGWGDIGYNFLVDLSGNLYEGHLGGDDAVGTHASGANKGSMALSLIGTFTVPTGSPPGIAPPSAMLNAAVELYAWKADHRQINVFEASDALPDIPWGLPNLMGHRDVYGGSATECPGEQAFDTLPWIRQQVAQRLGQVDDHIYVDELSAGFVKANANWHEEGVRGCGHNGHSYYTWSTMDPGASTNWGEWRPNVPATGRYEIQVYAPYCDTGSGETRGARYTVTHLNGTSQVVVDQDEDIGLWMSLGEFDLAAGSGNVIRLTDLTTTDEGRGVWFDALRLRAIEGMPVLSTPAAGTWSGDTVIDFDWSFTSSMMVDAARLRVATDAGFGNVLVDQSWSTAVTNYTHNFGGQHPTLYWQVTMDSTLGNTIPSAVNQFGVDLSPPSSAVYRIFRNQGSNTFYIYWQGSDALSGIGTYDVEYSEVGSGIWAPLNGLVGTTATATTFTPPILGQIYSFRTQATDTVGNNEAPNPDGDMSTDQAIVYSHAIMFPVVRHAP